MLPAIRYREDKLSPSLRPRFTSLYNRQRINQELAGAREAAQKQFLF